MSQLSREELQEILEQQLPGYVMVQEPLEDYELPQVEPEAVTPDLETLRKKYEEYSSPTDNTTDSESDRADHSPTGSEGAEDIIVVVEPKDAHDTWITGAGPKAVVISSEEKKIISVQG